MTATNERSAADGGDRRPDDVPLDMGAAGILQDFLHYYSRMFGQQAVVPDSPYVYKSLAQATRDRLVERWTNTNAAVRRSDGRRVGYLSLEFLVGRLMRNALLNLDLDRASAEAMAHIGLDLEDICDSEHEAGLGNGGLGRLAACFLDSCATLGLPVTGYGLRYHYGLFRQRIDNGYQVEEPDSWLRDGFPWEIERFDLAQVVHFGGTTETYSDEHGKTRHRWLPENEVLAIPFDVPVPGYHNNVVNTLRLWSAAATDEFDLVEFNAGGYIESVAAKNAAENITMVLYPNADTDEGRELRLRQEYLLVSASLQDTVRDWCSRHGEDFNGFADKHCFQMNDTHPAITVAELMRLLIDEHRIGWQEAWSITRRTMAYTNHTLLPEALEAWPEAVLAKLLPRLLEIIRRIDEEFIERVRERWPGDDARVERMSIFADGHEPMVRMAHLAVVGSFSVNGVAELHSTLLRQGLFHDFYELWPERFNNKTNGVTQRRWLAACNPGLAALISSRIGPDWVTGFEDIGRLRDCADDEHFRRAWRDVRAQNKQKLARMIHERCGLAIDTGMMFDIQVKRIHEYKRQLLNLLHAVHRYDRIVRGDDDLVPRAIIIGGKAAPGYAAAKAIIKCINDVAAVINADSRTDDRLRLIFLPDYNVSAMEVICPAADLSEQISTAGNEASGTGNMKFMMNGALTIGTLDGANVEIRDAVGEENFFLFGHTVEELAGLRAHYDPNAIIDGDADFSRVMTMLENGEFSGAGDGAFDRVVASIRDAGDAWMTAADFRSFVDAQGRVDGLYRDVEAWTRMSILNTAASARFSTDRTIRDYNRDIWRLDPLDIESP